MVCTCCASQAVFIRVYQQMRARARAMFGFPLRCADHATLGAAKRKREREKRTCRGQPKVCILEKTAGSTKRSSPMAFRAFCRRFARSLAYPRICRDAALRGGSTNCFCLSPAIFSPRGYCFAERATDASEKPTSRRPSVRERCVYGGTHRVTEPRTSLQR